MPFSQMEQLSFPIIADAGDLKRALDDAVRRTGLAAGNIRKDLEGVANDDWGDKLGKRFDDAFSDARLKTMHAASGDLTKVATGMSLMTVATLAGGVAVAALAVAWQRTTAAMAAADEIRDAATKVGVGVEALQEWRFALDEAGGEAKNADSAIQNFTKTLGLALNGSKEQLEWFGKLGIEPRQLASFQSAEDALAAVADAIANLDTEADRQAFASKLGIEPLLPLLKKGADGVAQLREEARTLGVVMSEEVITKAADAQDKLELLSKVVDTQLNVAFADLAPVIATAAGALADFLKELNSPAVKQGASAVRYILEGYSKGGVIGGAKAALKEGRFAQFAPLADDFGMNPDDPANIRMGVNQPAPISTANAEARLKVMLDALKKGRAAAAKDKVTPLPGFVSVEGMKLQTVDPSTVFDSTKSLSSDQKGPLQLNGAIDDSFDRLVEGMKARQQDIHDTLAYAIEGGLQAGFDDGLPGVLRYLGRELQRTLATNFADGLADILSAGSGGVKGGGFGGFVSSLFGGGRAIGGGVQAGRFYEVGEHGKELFAPGVSGSIIPNNVLRAAPSLAARAPSGGAVSLNVSVNAQGAIHKSEIEGMVMRGSQAAVQMARSLVPQDLTRRGRNRLGGR